jgi:hypothetical protein
MLQDLTAEECDLIRGAIKLIVNDVTEYRDIDEALEALMASVPQEPRDTRPIVMGALGKPKLSDLRDALLSLEGNLPHLNSKGGDHEH